MPLCTFPSLLEVGFLELTFGRLREIRKTAQDPLLFTTILLLGFLFLTFILLPIIRVLALPSLGEWRKYFERTAFPLATRNTLYMALISTASATTVGFILAYALAYVNIPGKSIFKTIAIFPLISPPFVNGLAFILLFGRRGLITHTLLGLRIDLYGWHGLWLAQTMAFFPVAYLVISGVLRSINPTLEYVARNLGVDGFPLFRTITLPLATPGVASAALLVAIDTLADFGNPMLIGGDFSVLATEAYMQIVGRYDTQMAAALCTVLLFPTLTFFILQRYWVSRKSYITVTGRSSMLERPPSPWYVKLPLFLFCLLLSSLVVSILIVIALGAFAKVWGVDWTLSFKNFDYAIFRARELYNSLRFASIAALVTAVLAMLTAYIVYRKEFPGRSILDFLAILPGAIPGTLIGIGYILAFNQPPLQLTGTAAIIIICETFRFIPVGYRAGISALQQIDISIEQASANLGADSLRTFKNIVLPLLKYAFTAGLVYCFVKSINTLSAVIFLVSPGNNVASVSILGLAEHGYWGQACALATAMIAITFTTLGVFRLAMGRKGQLFQM